MKALIILVLIICFTGNFNPAFSNSKAEYAKACEYLEKKGEVFFKFPIKDRSALKDLTLIISIDKVDGNDVYAYANKQGFDKFLQQNLDYEVLIPSGDLLENPKMYQGRPGEAYEWDRYPTYDAYVEMMYQFEADYPQLCKIEEIGESVQGRKLLVAKVSDNVSTKEAEPEFLYTSTMHGNELPGYVFMLRLIDTLLTGYSTDPQIKNLVDNIEIWINPLLNPDGTYKGGDSTVLGAVGYIGYNVDMNRDFPRLPETGTSPDPQVETKAIMDFMKEHHFVMSANFHAGMEAVIYPWHCVQRDHPDKEWFIHVAREYADTAQLYGPEGFFDYMDNGITNGYTLYPAIGTKIDWSNYYIHCREVQIELSDTKMLPEPQLDNFWSYNYKSLLNYIEQVLYGIRGTVKNLITGEPVKARVFIEDHDIGSDSSFVYSDSFSGHGDFYRPVYEGTYDIGFSAPGYETETIQNVQVKNGEAIVLNVKLSDGPGISIGSPNGGETWERGRTYNVIWYGGLISNIILVLFKGNNIVDTIVGALSNRKGSYLWNIPSNLPVGSDYLIRVEGEYLSSVFWDMSDSGFSIVDPVSIGELSEKKYIPLKENFSVTSNSLASNIRISFSLTQKSNIQIDIYSLIGKIVKHIDEGIKDTGYYHLYWNGRDNTGQQVSNGCYIVRVDFGDKAIARRFVFSR